jgi:uncharacterized protein YjbI with pentapeptide repeats
MAESQGERCRYKFPESFDYGEDNSPVHQSCCYRETWKDYDRCVWHADVDEEVTKPLDELQAQRETPANRELNYGGFSQEYPGARVGPEEIKNKILIPGELLDGVIDVLQENGDHEEYDFDFSGVALRQADLNGANLIETNLSGADLIQTDLSEANLVRADLRGAQLWKADFTAANLAEADLAEANLKRAFLSPAGLFNARLSGAILIGADLSESQANKANFSGADLGQSNLSEAYLSGADLTETDLTGADLSGADLSGADLSGADLTETDLTGADLTGADLSRADLSGADLSGVDLSTANLTTSLRKANLTDARLEGQDLRNYDLHSAQLSKANLTDADLSEADLSEANLERALLNRADLFDTRLSGARLEGAVLGNVQTNAGTFDNIKSKELTDNPPGLLTRCKRAILGPQGADAYRCIYDPKSTYNPPESEGTDDPPDVRAGGVYRRFEQLAADNALPEWQRRFFILRQDMQTRQLRREESRFKYGFALIQRALFGYGESFSRVIGWSAFVIGLFSLAYLAIGGIRRVSPEGGLGATITWTRLPEAPGVVWDSLYYSTLTFTALGFGDFRPTDTIGQLLTIVETATGAVLLALLVFVLGRRAAQ